MSREEEKFRLPENLGICQESFLGEGRCLLNKSNIKIMKTNSIILFSGQVFILISALCFLGVSLMAFNSPQSVMDMVGVQLNNTDALSSIRGVYGGVGLTLAIALVYLMKKVIIMKHLIC